MSKALVLTSLNMDYTVRTKKIPKAGETVIASELIENFGGKGANQLLSIQRLGVATVAFGNVGADAPGGKYLTHLQQEGVDTQFINQVSERTGLAFITVEDSGQNNICILPGANDVVEQNSLQEIEGKIEEVDIVVSQLEVPIEATKEIFKKAKKLNKVTVLNPAPFVASYQPLLEFTDILIPVNVNK